mgnify:CR=1 FL=1
METPLESVEAIASTADSFAEAVRMGVEVQQKLRQRFELPESEHLLESFRVVRLRPTRARHVTRRAAQRVEWHPLQPRVAAPRAHLRHPQDHPGPLPH